MNKTKQKFKYITFDFIGAGSAWILFNLFRKSFIESELYGTNVQLQLSANLFISTFLVGVFWFLLYYFSGYYYNVRKKSRLQDLSHTLIYSIIGAVFLFFTLLLDDIISSYKDYYYSFGALLGLHFIFTYLPRYFLTSYAINNIRTGKWGFNTIIIGSNGKAIKILKEFSGQNKSAGYNFVGFINVHEKVNPELENLTKNLGQFNKIGEIIEKQKVEEVIVAIESSEHKELEHIISQLQKYNISIKLIPDLFEILIGKTELSLVEGAPLLNVSTALMPVWEINFKFLFDKIFSLIFITLFSPLYLFAALGVKLSSPGPIFYRQKRVGLNGKEFIIYKFRSMVQNAETSTPKLSSVNDERVTKFGRFMRKSRLDEIPQFYNVLKGDMTIVGPRPERQYYIEQIIKIAPEFRLLLKIKPGITSLGQVKFGYAENLDEMVQRLKYDIIYVKNMSLYLDFKILIYTILTIIKRDGK